MLPSIVVPTAVGHLCQEQAANQQLHGKIKEENSLQELQYNDIGLCSPRIGSLPVGQGQSGGCSSDFLVMRSHCKLTAEKVSQ